MLMYEEMNHFAMELIVVQVGLKMDDYPFKRNKIERPTLLMEHPDTPQQENTCEFSFGNEIWEMSSGRPGESTHLCYLIMCIGMQ